MTDTSADGHNDGQPLVSLGTMRQEAPYPAELAQLVLGLTYRPGWGIALDHIDRGQGSAGLTLVITTLGYDSYHPDRGETYRVAHYMPVPAASYNRQSWRRWLFEQFALVEQHECMEFFAIDGERPFAPNHGPGFDPYVVRELTTDDDRRTSFRGLLNPPADSDVGSDPLANIRAGVDYADRTYGTPTT